MTNLKYRVNSDGERPDGHPRDDAVDASLEEPLASIQHTHAGVQDQASSLHGELDDVKAERIIGEIEAAGTSGGIRSILDHSPARVRDPGYMLPTADGRQSPDADPGQRGSSREASDMTEVPGEGQQWILPSLLAVLAISLGIFFLVNFSQFSGHSRGVASGMLAKASPAQSALDSTTRSKLAELNRQVIFWMTQFSEGFNPGAVTLKRVREDLALSSDQMLDSWGRPIRYEAADAGYTLRSSGPDKQYNTEDDLVELQPQFPSHIQPVQRGQPLSADSHSQ